MKSFGKELSIFAILVVVCLATGLKNPNFVSPENLQNTSRLIGIYGIFSIGMGLVIITGGIDLSVGSVFALLGVIMSMLLVDYHFNPFVASILIIAAAAAIGAGHGALVTKARMQPFIVTLCGLLLYRGLARFVTGDNTKGFTDAPQAKILKDIVQGNYQGIPIPMWMLIVVGVIMYFVLHKSVFGVRLYAVGRNEESARFAGINTQGIILMSYVLCGLLVGISTILLAYYTNSVSPSSHGQSYELYAIAAAVLGGFSLRGGEGSIIGVILGTILLQVLRNLINILHIPSQLEFAVMGLVILIGVWVDSAVSGRKWKKA